MQIGDKVFRVLEDDRIRRDAAHEHDNSLLMLAGRLEEREDTGYLF
jgi:hypothetical protein